MSRKWLAYLGVPAVALAGVLLVTPTASAQRFGRMGGVGIGFGSGYGYGNGVGLGFGNGYGWGTPYYGNYYGNNFGGNRWGGYGWNNGWNNGYYNNYSYNPVWGSGWNSSPSNYGYTWNSYPSTTYSTYQPAYSYNGQQFAANYNMMPNQGSTSFYPADQNSNVPETAALINVRVPQDAKITFSDQETKQQGQFRQFVTPALDQGQTYYYMVRAQWTENGQSMDRTRKVLVHAGDRINIDVAADMTAVSEMTPARLPNRSQSGYEGTTDPNRNDQLNRNTNETVPAPADRSNLNRDATPGATDNLNRSTNPGGTTGTSGTTGGTSNSSGTSGTTNPGGTSGTTTTPGGTGTAPATGNNPGTNR